MVVPTKLHEAFRFSERGPDALGRANADLEDATGDAITSLPRSDRRTCAHRQGAPVRPAPIAPDHSAPSPYGSDVGCESRSVAIRIQSSSTMSVHNTVARLRVRLLPL